MKKSNTNPQSTVDPEDNSWIIFHIKKKKCKIKLYIFSGMFLFQTSQKRRLLATTVWQMVFPSCG